MFLFFPFFFFFFFFFFCFVGDQNHWKDSSCCFLLLLSLIFFHLSHSVFLIDSSEREKMRRRIKELEAQVNSPPPRKPQPQKEIQPLPPRRPVSHDVHHRAMSAAQAAALTNTLPSAYRQYCCAFNLEVSLFFLFFFFLPFVF